MSEPKTIFLVCMVLKGKGQIIHVAFPDTASADKEAKRLEPIVRKQRDDFLYCEVVPVPFYGSGE